MRRALRLAERAIGLSDPNPRVGCCLLDSAGQLIGEGFTQQAGGPHAEIMALRDARARGASTQGCTAVVTLEPCSHHGRTPPCADALVEAGVARVVIALPDPNPAVNGAGIARLRAAGVVVALAPADLAAAAHELNIGFISRMQRGRPFVRLKAAASADGVTALPNGQSQWITGPQARADGHAFRRRAGAILTGIGTVLADDPRLDVRDVETFLQPLRVIVDSQLRIAPQARVLAAPGTACLVHAGAPTRAELASIEQIALPASDGRVDLHALLARLAERGVNELHVEAGATLNGALLAAGLVDEILLYQAPLLLGQGLPIASLPALPDLAHAARWRRIDATPVGEDLRLRFRPA
jgi:diaminohydroxyphosphoribosylaminopyrimidine deaminase/5-amino-6-(5-phosphoribosylamino)uracil reductase